MATKPKKSMTAKLLKEKIKNVEDYVAFMQALQDLTDDELKDFADGMLLVDPKSEQAKAVMSFMEKYKGALDDLKNLTAENEKLKSEKSNLENEKEAIRLKAEVDREHYDKLDASFVRINSEHALALAAAEKSATIHKIVSGIATGTVGALILTVIFGLGAKNLENAKMQEELREAIVLQQKAEEAQKQAESAVKSYEAMYSTSLDRMVTDLKIPRSLLYTDQLEDIANGKWPTEITIFDEDVSGHILLSAESKDKYEKDPEGFITPSELADLSSRENLIHAYACQYMPAEFAEALNTITQLKADLKLALESADPLAMETIMKLNQQLKEANENAEKIKKELEASKATIASLESQLKTKEEAIKAAQEAKAAAETAKAAAEEAAKNWENKYNKSSEKYDRLEEEYNTLLADYEKLEKEKAALNERYNVIVTQYNALEEAYNKIKDNTSDSNTAEIERLEEQIKILNGRIKKLEEEIKAKDDKIEEKEAAIVKKDKQLNQVTEELEATTDAYVAAQSKVDKLEANLKTTNDKLNKLTEEFNTISAKLEEQKKANEDLQHQNDVLNADIARANNLIAALEAKINQMELEQSAIQTENLFLKEEIDKLQREIDELQNKVLNGNQQQNPETSTPSTGDSTQVGSGSENVDDLLPGGTNNNSGLEDEDEQQNGRH